MPKIIIMNAATGQMSGRSPTAKQRDMAAKTAIRSVWLASNGDIVVTPVEIENGFMQYVCGTLGFDTAGVSFVVAGECGILTDDALCAPETVSAIASHIADSSTWEVNACYLTSGVARFSAALGLGAFSSSDFATQKGCDLLNRKSHFRQLAIGTGLPLAEGNVVQSVGELRQSIADLLMKTGEVIVKTDNGAGSMGNVVLVASPTEPLPGGRETICVAGDIETLAVRLWGEMAQPDCATLVVESYHRATEMFYLEYDIVSDGRIVYVNSGTIKLQPDTKPGAKEVLWVGLELPAEIDSRILSMASTRARDFVAMVAGIGYRGPLNIDIILTDTGELVFNEVNARWGGGTVMHALATRLRRTPVSEIGVVASFRNIDSPPLSEFIHLLQGTGLTFSPDTGEGVVVLAGLMCTRSPKELILIATTRARLREMESQLFSLLASIPTSRTTGDSSRCPHLRDFV